MTKRKTLYQTTPDWASTGSDWKLMQQRQAAAETPQAAVREEKKESLKDILLGRSQGWRLTSSEVAQALRSAAASGSYIAERLGDF